MLAAVVCLTAVFIRIGSNDYERETIAFVEHTVNTLSAELSQISDVHSESTRFLLDQCVKYTAVNVAICDENGEILLTAGEDRDMLFALTPQIIEDVNNNGYFTELGKADGKLPKAGFYSVTKTFGGNFAAVSYSAENLSLSVLLVATQVILSALLAICVIICVIYFVTRRLLHPLEEMTLAAKRFGNGDFSQKIKCDDTNQLGFLAYALNEMADSIANTEETRKNFISNVSHELKTPMTNIGGFVDGILDGTIPPESRKEYLLIVSDETKRLTRLVNNMLNLSAFEDGAKTLTLSKFDIMPIFISTALMFEKELDKKHTDVTGLDRAPFEIYADEDLIRQVVYNLFENAVKFSSDNGYITIEATKNGNNDVVRIRNSGEGLKPTEITRVFEKFYKTDISRGMDKTGVGLGLPLVSAIIKLHEGNLIVRSDPGNFTEFEFSLHEKSV